jgi:Protein of unknown function (DUF1439)
VPCRPRSHRPPTTAALLLAVTALVGCGLAGRIIDRHLDIGQAELQARVAARFPVQQCQILIACLDLSNPVVALKEGDDRIGFMVDVRITLGTHARTGRIGIAGRPRYAPEGGQLFLDGLQITTLELAGLPEEYAELVKARGAIVARQALQSQPVYTLDANSTKGALARRTVRDVKVVNGKLRIAFVGSGE